MQQLYSNHAHINMLNDKNRMNFYYNKIYKNSCIKGKLCCDIGSGTGILALFALKAGAKHVYIIENQMNMIDIIKYNLNIHNINSDSYTIIQGWSTDITLPEKIDIIIHELIGEWGNGEQGLSYVSEFKNRNLKNDGIIIPDIIEVHLTLQHTNELYNMPDKNAIPDINDLKISNLISKLNEDITYYGTRSHTHPYVTVTSDNVNYLQDTVDCNTEIIKYDLINDTISEINSKTRILTFTPKNNKIVSLLSTLKYYCSDDTTEYGDTWSNNGNWAKQQILIFPQTINKNGNITGNINLTNNPRCKYSQKIGINLNVNEKNILHVNFITSTGFNTS